MTSISDCDTPLSETIAPGWLDKSVKWRRKATHFLDNMVLLALDPEWIKQLPNAKLPDRIDFMRYGPDMPVRMKAWSAAVATRGQLADEW